MRTERPVTVLAGRYRLEEELGRSATGMIWRATDTLLSRTVTVKLVHPELAGDAASAERLTEEARRVATVRSPAIARLLDTGEEDGIVFLVREHVDGSSVRSLLEREGPLAADRAMRIVLETLEALAEAHDAGVLHLNLEPDDVLITSDGTVRVTDFGIGAVICATREPDDVIRMLGSGRLAPEQRSGGAIDVRTDVFGAGALAFELLTGEAPDERTSPRSIRGDVPRPIDRAVTRALSEDPSERFPDARSFAAEIAGRAGEGPSAPLDDDRPSGALRSWLLVPALIALGAAAVIVLGLWLGGLEVGGPLGIRVAEEPVSPPPQTATLLVRPVAVTVLDPFGDGSENDSTAPSAIDGDRATAWRSENYFDGELRKPGVGLVFDLGGSRLVDGVRLSTPSPGFAFALAVGDDPATLLDAVGGVIVAQGETRAELEGAGRYVLVWITSVVPVSDGDRAEVAELRVMVTAGA